MHNFQFPYNYALSIFQQRFCENIHQVVVHAKWLCMLFFLLHVLSLKLESSKTPQQPRVLSFFSSSFMSSKLPLLRRSFICTSRSSRYVIVKKATREANSQARTFVFEANGKCVKTTKTEAQCIITIVRACKEVPKGNTKPICRYLEQFLQLLRKYSCIYLSMWTNITFSLEGT